MECYDLFATITEYIHVHNNSKSCIDNILTNVSNDDFVSGVTDPCISDHYGQYHRLSIYIYYR